MKEYCQNLWKQILEMFQDEDLSMDLVMEDLYILTRGCPHPMAYNQNLKNKLKQ